MAISQPFWGFGVHVGQKCAQDTPPKDYEISGLGFGVCGLGGQT